MNRKKTLLASILLSAGILFMPFIASANTPPSADKQTLVIPQDTEATLNLTGSDADGDTLTYEIVQKPRRGTLTQINPGSPDLTYKPNPKYTGKDQFLFRVSDGKTPSLLASVDISIQENGIVALNAANIATHTKEKTPVSIKLLGSGGNGNRLEYSANPPGNGSVSIRRDTAIYKPAIGFHGSDHFTYTATDGAAVSEIATVSISVSAINNIPVASNQTVNVSKNTPTNITLTGSDAEDAIPTFRIVRQPVNGSLGILTGQTITYTPKSGYIGNDSFTFQTVDSTGSKSSVATIYLHIRSADTWKVVQPSAEHKLNDSGITLCADDADNGSGVHNNNVTCGNTDAQADPLPTGQDANTGRDADTNLNSAADGHAGFSFTKLGTDGSALAIQANAWDANGNEAEGTQWSCVKDNVTGLIWEVKTDDAGLHDQDDRYTWYEPNGTLNAGDAGYQQPSDAQAAADNAICQGYNSNDPDSYCNTLAYIKRINHAGYCGGGNWRLPTLEEQRSIASFGHTNPAIEPLYFPNTLSDKYWSALPSTQDNTTAWYLDFAQGQDGYSNKAEAYPVRLVRSQEIIPDCNNKTGQDPACGVETYNTAVDTACGVENYNKNRSSVCGVELYQNQLNPACGVNLYKSSTGSVCGVALYKSCQNSAGCGWSSCFGITKCKAKTCRTAYCGVERYNTCRHSDFGVESYNSCRTSSNPVELYKECRDTSFGVETHKSCALPKFGVDQYKACRLPKFGKEQCDN